MKVYESPIALLGGNGFIGSALRGTLEGSGAEVRVLSAPRIGTPSRSIAGIRRDSGSYPDIEELSAKLVGCPVVINAAGVADATAGGSLDSLFGANSVLPGVLELAAREAGAARFIHISSAAVQGRVLKLSETPEASPFSPYSFSKALGEQVLRGSPIATCFRPTSVHGSDRPISHALARFARSPWRSVSADGRSPTPQVLVEDVAAAVAWCANFSGSLPPIVLQPWSGLTTSDVLELLSGRRPRQVPRRFAKVLVASLWRCAFMPKLAPQVRRLEMVWFGQEQEAGWLSRQGWEAPSSIASWTLLRERIEDNSYPTL